MHISSMTKNLTIWFIAISFSIFVSTFLHECAHGLGSYIMGVRVSTGFNRVGDYGKFPHEPDFRSNFILHGKIELGGFSGPLITWLLAIIFTLLLIRRDKQNFLTIFIGSMSVANSFLRIVPVFFFFISAISGNFVLEDEVAWGLNRTEGVNFPMNLGDFKRLATYEPEIFLSNPYIYIWPFISLLICSICLVSSYKKLSSIFKDSLSHSLFKWVFGLIPLASFPLTFTLLNWLDGVIRINW